MGPSGIQSRYFSRRHWLADGVELFVEMLEWFLHFADSLLDLLESLFALTSPLLHTV